jgi:hypothetical protein
MPFSGSKAVSLGFSVPHTQNSNHFEHRRIYFPWDLDNWAAPASKELP